MHQRVKCLSVILSTIFVFGVFLSYAKSTSPNNTDYLDRNPRPLSLSEIFVAHYEYEADGKVVEETIIEENTIELIEAPDYRASSLVKHGLTHNTHFDVYAY